MPQRKVFQEAFNTLLPVRTDGASHEEVRAEGGGGIANCALLDARLVPLRFYKHIQAVLLKNVTSQPSNTHICARELSSALNVLL